MSQTVSYACNMQVWRVIVVLGAAGLVVGGFVHLVHGGTEMAFCSKESWSVYDTFVDVTDYTEQPARLQPDKPVVVRALLRCG
jgi:hypothetical protein